MFGVVVPAAGGTESGDVGGGISLPAVGPALPPLLTEVEVSGGYVGLLLLVTTNPLTSLGQNGCS